MSRPQFVTDELARREKQARDAYRAIVWNLPDAALLMSEEEYVRRFLAAMEPVKWTTGGTA